MDYWCVRNMVLGRASSEFILWQKDTSSADISVNSLPTKVYDGDSLKITMYF